MDSSRVGGCAVEYGGTSPCATATVPLARHWPHPAAGLLWAASGPSSASCLPCALSAASPPPPLPHRLSPTASPPPPLPHRLSPLSPPPSRQDGCVEIAMLGVTRSLNAHVSGAMAIWQYVQQQLQQQQLASASSSAAAAVGGP
jgi:hypothetical protein